MTEKISEKFVQNLLGVMPNWHAKLVRPFKDTLNREMSLETYYCLQTLKINGTMTMTQLANQLKVPKQQATKLIDALSMHRFVERVYNEGDRRAIWIRLTPEAVTYLDEYYLKNTAFIRMLEEQLTGEELIQLNGAMEVLDRILPKLK
ncbi:MarR family transcriptional regulator [Blautia schinkii]|nr:MarR family transcriptional regulator [Blautia schinkii]